MFCPNCGNQIEYGEAFCTKCGKKIDGKSTYNSSEAKGKDYNEGLVVALTIIVMTIIMAISVPFIKTKMEDMAKKKSDEFWTNYSIEHGD